MYKSPLLICLMAKKQSFFSYDNPTRLDRQGSGEKKTKKNQYEKIFFPTFYRFLKKMFKMENFEEESRGEGTKRLVHGQSPK